VKNMVDRPIGILRLIIPFYMAKRPTSSRNLLTYRYNQLDKAIENAENYNGAAPSYGHYEW
jgi:trehalose/maltose hydrolase-like predicted phosphorylase